MSARYPVIATFPGCYQYAAHPDDLSRWPLLFVGWMWQEHWACFVLASSVTSEDLFLTYLLIWEGKKESRWVSHILLQVGVMWQVAFVSHITIVTSRCCFLATVSVAKRKIGCVCNWCLWNHPHTLPWAESDGDGKIWWSVSSSLTQMCIGFVNN